jgi:hypothetical protein
MSDCGLQLGVNAKSSRVGPRPPDRGRIESATNPPAVDLDQEVAFAKSRLPGRTVGFNRDCQGTRRRLDPFHSERRLDGVDAAGERGPTDHQEEHRQREDYRHAHGGSTSHGQAHQKVTDSPALTPWL